MRLFEMFAGIGAQAKALKKGEVVGFSEIDSKIFEAYCKIHNNGAKNYGDITKIRGQDMPKNIDILTYSFPCQDLSTIGKQKGLEKGTRSGLLWEVGRILEEMEEKPKFLLLENVATLLSPKFAPLFEIWQKKLEEMGYFNQIFILNSLNFGIPQNRKRLFMISSPYVKDIEAFWFKNNLETIRKPLKPLYSFLRFSQIEEAIKSQPNNTFSRCEIFKKSKFLLNEGGEFLKFANTITTSQDRYPNAGIIPFNYKKGIKAPYRYLTPRECFLLMGFSEKDYEKVSYMPRTLLYKMAGNSIVVSVLEEIFNTIEKLNFFIDNDKRI